MPTVSPVSIAEQREILMRGVEEIVPDGSLTDLLRRAQTEERPLRVKLGIDPTASDIHLGFAVVLRKLRQFQDLGHIACLVIGDFTATIGDPAGRSKTRPTLTRDDVVEHVRSYEQQLYRILDRDRTELSYNSDWLASMRFADVIALASQYTVARLLERDDFSKRYTSKQPIFVHELMYPLCQGYDSVAIRADIELGGTDQKFNNLVGRDLQRNAGQEPQMVMLMPLLVGTDGVEKMSKSLGNYVGIDEPPAEQFGKLMSISDDRIGHYYELTTDVPLDELSAMMKRLDDGETHPMDAKLAMARRVVASYHGDAQARQAEAAFTSVFRERRTPQEMPEINVTAELDGQEIWIVRLIALAGFASSNREARQLVEQGAVSIDGSRIGDTSAQVRAANGSVLKVGKRRFVRLIVESEANEQRR